MDEDILTFFKYKFGVIRKKSDDDLPPNWPGQNYMDRLVSSAHGLFIYAATICRFIEEGSKYFPTDDLLRLVLPNESITNASLWKSRNVTTHESPTKELDMMYTQVLIHYLKGVPHEKDKELLTMILRQILGAIVTLHDPLSLIAIARLLNMSHKIIKKTINHLCSVLEVPNKQEHPIRLFHPSFRDFLVNNKRCSSKEF